MSKDYQMFAKCPHDAKNTVIIEHTATRTVRKLCDDCRKVMDQMSSYYVEDMI